MRGTLFSLLCQQALKRKGRPSGLIGQYKPYLNSNDSPTRDILKDYSGNGHDIQLYNFGYELGSGYGKYLMSLNKLPFNNSTYDYKKAYSTYTRFSKVGRFVRFIKSNAFTPYGAKVKFKVTGLKKDENHVKVKWHHFLTSDLPDKEEIYYGNFEISIPTEDDFNSNLEVEPYVDVFVSGVDQDINVNIELIPDYPGALVSDGVDDYGLCENFPILTKEKGYTICAIRKHITFPFAANSGFISKRDMRINIDVGTVFEKWGNASTPESTCSFGLGTAVDIDNEKLFSYQTSNIYNGQSISVGSQEDNPCLILFGSTINESDKVVGFSNSALYALEIYDRDLTDEEIQSVKEAMVREYNESVKAIRILDNKTRISNKTLLLN